MQPNKITKKENKKKNRIIKKARKIAIKKPRNKYVHWTCIKCKEVIPIHINLCNIELYTDERKKKYICLNCR